MIDKDLLLEFNRKVEEKIKREKIYAREVKLEPIKDKVLTIVGPRRSGKTYLLYYLLKSNIKNSIYFDFEHSAFENVNHKDIFDAISFLSEIKGEKIKYLLLDEIQEIKNWQKLVRSLMDMGYYVIATGSSSKLMSKEISTSLRGRSIERIILPLSFREFLKFRNIKLQKYLSISDKNKILKELKKFVEIGGYPEIVLNEEKKDEILRNYFLTILYKDFVERFKIEHIRIARFIFEFCLQNFSNEISIRKIVNYVNTMVGKNVKNYVYEYVDKLPETLNIFFIERFNKSVYKRKSWPKKLYVVDLGLSNIISFEENLGRRIENIVFLELFRNLNEDPLLEIYYLKTQNYEVDFLIKSGTKIKQLINVTYANSFDEIDKREIRSLLHANELFKKDNPELIIITWDYEDERELSWFGKKGKVKFIPLWKWLLSKDM